MPSNYLLAITASSILALTLAGCANNQQNAGSVLNQTQKTLATSQNVLNRTQAVTQTAQNVANTSQSAPQAVAGGLTQALTQRLGVTSQQASGGAGALLQVAKSRMTGNDFQQLNMSIPEVGQLVNQAPAQQSGLSQIASGTSVLMGDKSNTLGQAANLASTFQQLGMSSNMVGQFVPVVKNYIAQHASSYLTNALTSSLSGF